MEALAAIGLVSNVIGFIDTGNKLWAIIKEYSSSAGAPKEIITLSKRLEVILKILGELDESGRARLDHEKLALKVCSEEAEKFRLFLEGLKFEASSGSGVRSKWLSRRKEGMEKAWKAIKTVRGRSTMEKFQTSLNRILELVEMQQNLRVEGTTLRIENNTEILLERTEMTLRGLNDLSLSTSKKASNPAATGERPAFMVPFSRNLGFVGREEIMTQLDSILRPENYAVQLQVQKAALCGLGGVGKSHIALEYSYRFKERYPESSVFWVHASSGARFEESYTKISSDFEIPGYNDSKRDIMQLVRDWFESRYERPWIMIIDNVDDNYIFGSARSGKPFLEYVPQVSKGCVLYTSRNRDIGVDLVGDPISVDVMTEFEAQTLLGDRLRNTSIMSERVALLKELDYLPLAIIQAVSYMTKRRKSISQYLRLYQDDEASKLKLLGHKFSESGRESEALVSVATTWLISFHHIRLESPRAIDILFLANFFERQGIPVSLLTSEEEQPVDFEEAIGILEAYALVAPDETSTSYSIHRLVQTITRAWLREQEGEASRVYASRALQTVSARLPISEFENWVLCAQ